jgi:hypothetical protein
MRRIIAKRKGLILTPLGANQNGTTSMVGPRVDSAITVHVPPKGGTTFYNWNTRFCIGENSGATYIHVFKLENTDLLY